jgi:uncharacterized membrane protein
MGLFIGTLVYFLMAGKLIKKDTSITKHISIIEKFFTREEKEILKILAKNNNVTQAKITSQTNLPRLKVFRIIEKLKNKNLVEKQEQGKIRIIKIKEDIRNLIKHLN